MMPRAVNPRKDDTHVLLFRGTIIDSGKLDDIEAIVTPLADWHAAPGHFEAHPADVDGALIYIEGESPFTMRPIHPPTFEELPL